jgi:glycosyltransferase involved in cell wall biosynthesis
VVTQNRLTAVYSNDFAPKMNTHIVILTGNHLCHNPRVIKEGTTLANAGYAVTAIGAWSDRGLKARDLEIQRSLPFSFKPAIDGTENAPRRLRLRVSAKIESIAHRLARCESRSQLGYAYSALRAASRQPADLYIAHSEAAMAVAADLLHDGRLVGIDLEDWFSEDLPLEARKHRPVRLLRNFELKLLTFGGYSTCPSRAMSEALAKEFGCRQPTVIYNAFPWSDRESIDGLFKDRRDRRLPSVHWFSQTLGQGRGLEDLIAALPLLKQDAEIHLRGNPAGGFENWLAHRVPEVWRGRVVLHGLVPYAELLSRIAEHDIGFAGETPLIRSRDLTVTNKILHYLLAGLAVVASDTAGQREVAAQAPGAVFLYPSGDASTLAARLDALLGSADTLGRAKEAALDAAGRTFCWERQEKALVESIARALHWPAS